MRTGLLDSVFLKHFDLTVVDYYARGKNEVFEKLADYTLFTSIGTPIQNLAVLQMLTQK